MPDKNIMEVLFLNRNIFSEKIFLVCTFLPIAPKLVEGCIIANRTTTFNRPGRKVH